jgi:hypothetical protein
MAADGLITGPTDLGLALRPTELVIFGNARGGTHPGGLRAFSPQHCAHLGRREDRQVRANLGAWFEPRKLLRKKTAHLRQRRAGTVA